MSYQSRILRRRAWLYVFGGALSLCSGYAAATFFDVSGNLEDFVMAVGIALLGTGLIKLEEVAA
ncbi:hypothetical protein AB4Y45_35540 [Paraburkholderia sp. EG287A]|uniref:hypothetical protein n=1 Tax=Paraburkholderia sp. EG287A TaxID=3237012 RepID=UPI0034D30E28